jgi:hypothetical protein
MPRKTRLIAAAILGTAPLARGQITFSIDQGVGHSAVSPLIYGGNQSALTGANPTIDRLGGDRWTAYNWTNNASNAGSDYEYSSDNYLGGGSTPGGAVLPFLSNAAANNEAAIVTVPINGYLADNFVGPVNPSIPPQSSPNFVPEYPAQAQDPAPAANHVYQNGFVSLVKSSFSGSSSRPAPTRPASRPASPRADTSPGVVAARLQAPRSLWDPTYSENSCISNPYSQGGKSARSS